MNIQNNGSVGSVYTGHFPEPASSQCPDCETRFPLQILLAELLCKNQMLRLELQEARSQLAAAHRNLFGQESYEQALSGN
jgi:hypothetical protein